ncbi:MAG: hypothetical protein B7Z55_01535 [Planctomycetales bacterium 12-60-4]|nr:MAG: hypothetical protein B7Z55_01535 [Planctomycetales bacterium 12-60-4]
MSESLRGQCLVAAKSLRDPHFFKTVVIIVEHGDHGAMGLVVNRPSSILVCNALAKHFSLPDADELVFLGGPVEPAALLILHNLEDLSEGERAVIPGVFIGSSADAFEEVVRRIGNADDTLQYRVFSGCAGWAPGQLEGEVANGDWHVVSPLADAAFCEDPYALYPRMLQRVFEEHRLLPHSSSDPAWN